MFRFTGNPLSGTYNQYLVKFTHLVKSRCVEAVQDAVSVMAAYSQYAAITVTTSCTASTHLILTMCVIFN